MKELYPLLVIGVVAFERAKEAQFHLVSLENDTVRDLLEELLIARPRDLFLTDYALLNRGSRSVLLI